MDQIEAVTFDAGGTMIEPWPSVGEVYASVAHEFGIDCSAARLNAQFVNAWTTRAGFQYSRDDWHHVVRQAFLGISQVSPQLFDAIYERFAQSDAWLIYDDVIPALQTLESLGVKLAVISNWDDRLIPLLEKLGLATYFDHIVVSAVHGTHKPDPRIFHHAADLLGVSANRILHIGDSLREDIAGAKAAGASALRIRRSASSPSPLGGERVGVRGFSAGEIQSLTLIPDIISKSDLCQPIVNII